MRVYARSILRRAVLSAISETSCLVYQYGEYCKMMRYPRNAYRIKSRQRNHLGRTNRARKRQAKRSLDEILNSDPCEQLHDQSYMSAAENGKNCQQCDRLQAEKNHLQAECDSLRRKLKDLKKQRLCERRSLNARIKYWRQLNKSEAGNIQHMFSSGDVKCLRRGKKSVRWSKEDILEALDLRTVRSSGNTTFFDNNSIRYSLWLSWSKRDVGFRGRWELLFDVLNSWTVSAKFALTWI